MNAHYAVAFAYLGAQLEVKDAEIAELRAEVARLKRDLAEEPGSLAITNRRKVPKDLFQRPDVSSAEFWEGWFDG
jgi:hypothetical protein